ncbi:MAG: DUF1573 domain-containing protein [Planctomycetota bacterium]
MRTITALSLAATLSVSGTALAQPSGADTTAQSADRQVTGPKLEFMPEEVDFGQIDDSKIVEKSITVSNVGDEVLRISREEGGVRASCGCTVPTLPKYEIQPGESIDMTVRFDPRNRNGDQRKTISITPEGSNAARVLPVNAFVVQRVQIVEGLAQFGNVDQGDEASIEINVRGMTPDFKVTEAVASRDDMFVTEILGHEVVDREDPVTGAMTQVGQSTIRITLTPEAPIGRTDGKLTIRTNDPIASEKEVRTVVNVAGDVRVDPPVIRLGALEAGAEFEHTITVFSNKDRSFNIERVLFITSDLSESDKSLIETSHEPIAAERGQVGHTVTLRGTVSDTMRIVRGRLVVVTDAPGQRVISTNVAGVVRVR